MFCNLILFIFYSSHVLQYRMQIENNITQEYRAQEPNIPNNAPTMKPKTKPATRSAKKSTIAALSEDLMELLMKRCMDFIHTQMRQIPDQVAEVSHPNFIVYSMFAVLNHATITKFIFLLQRLLEKLNKAGVMYKPAAVVPSAENDPNEVDSFENGPYEKKEFVYKEDMDSDGQPIIDMTQPDIVLPDHKTVPEVLCIYLSVYNFLV